MKIVKNRIGIVLCMVIAVAMCSCEREGMTADRGLLPSLEGNGTTPAVSLQSRNGKGNSVRAMLWDAPFTDVIFFSLDRPASGTVEVSVEIDMTLVAVYNQEHGLTGSMAECKPFPVENVTIPNGGVLTAADGVLESSELTITLTGDEIPPFWGEQFLLPLVIKTVTGGVEQNRVLFYEIMRGSDESPTEFGDFDPLFVGYINTEKVKPEIANQFYIAKTDIATFEDKYFTFFDLVNLNVSQIRYDAKEKRPMLFLNPDITYVLTHAERYIKPVQVQKRQVCLVIKGGNSGLGFCNMNDAQIADFAFQVKTTVSRYGLDGVNLWDEGAGYGRAGMPAVNTTSYPKLIKALREAMPDKLITLVDIGEPTASFDVAHGGIKVGELIDYAWSGYLLECVNPWKADQVRKPINGINKKQYEGIILPILPLLDTEYATTTEDVKTKLIAEGLDKVFVFNDIPPFTHGQESTTGGGVYGLLVTDIYDNVDWDAWTGEMYGVIASPRFGYGGYGAENAWLKDW